MRLALTYNRKRSEHEEEAEFDSIETIQALTRILVSLGHVVTPIDVSCSIPQLVARLRRVAPDLVFNLAEGHRGCFREAFYPALFEQLGVRHTGSTASVLALCLDKALAKRVVAAAGVPVPCGCFVRDISELSSAVVVTTMKTATNAVIVKPNYEGSSKGITQASVVTVVAGEHAAANATLRSVVINLLARYPEGVLIEQYLDGTDVSVGFIDGLGILTPIGYSYDEAMTIDRPFRIMDLELKQGPTDLVRVEVPARLDESVSATLIDVATRAFSALAVTGFGRADFRITPSGEVYFLEMNPLPSLAPADEDLYAAAAWMGRSPSEMLACIVAASDQTSDRW